MLANGTKMYSAENLRLAAHHSKEGCMLHAPAVL